MRILGIDTATATASVALLEDGQLIAERTHCDDGAAKRAPSANSKTNHAEIILPLVESVFQTAPFSLTEVSGIAVSIGPGSFTGLRIGLSTVKGLAYGRAIPVVGISTLLATAARVTDFEGLICPLLDARKKEVYASLFRRRGDGLTRLTEDVVTNAIEIIDLIRTIDSQSPCLFIGDGAKTYGELLTDSFKEKFHLATGDSYSSVAAAVARLAEDNLRRAKANELGPLVPLYVRAAEAQWKMKKFGVTV